jgi:D-alanine-D-alanine ligase
MGKKNEIVLIADRLYQSCEEIDINSSCLEMISDEYFTEIEAGLKSISCNLVHYNTPKELIDNISKHTNSIVFTIYGGKDSRNRMALIPAICESYGVKFVGADTYARVVCQDKYLSKVLAKKNNIKTPRGVLIDKISRLSVIEELEVPVVVKPNLEGSSIGVVDSSLIYNHKDAIKYAEKMFIDYKQPILVEEFINGREICICILGTTKQIGLLEAMEVQYVSNKEFFYNKLYTAFDKHKSDEPIVHTSCTDLLTDKEINAIKDLYFSLGKMDFMRIDGRLNDNGFCLIELTPDAYIGEHSSIADAGKLHGMSYSEVLTIIINNALEYYHIPYSSYIKS